MNVKQLFVGVCVFVLVCVFVCLCLFGCACTYRCVCMCTLAGFRVIDLDNVVRPDHTNLSSARTGAHVHPHSVYAFCASCMWKLPSSVYQEICTDS